MEILYQGFILIWSFCSMFLIISHTILVGAEKNAEYLAAHWLETIEEYGPNNITAICTDGARNNVKAAAMVKDV